LAFLLSTVQAHADPVVVGSKRFTESYILGEIVRQTLERAGISAQHKQGLGNTGILEQALANGSVDVYPEYTGTIVREMLKREGNPSLDVLNQWLAPRGLKAMVPLGFNNTYALAVPEALAVRLGLTRISDLASLPPGALKLGLSHEFQVRADGWPGLQKTYALPQSPGSGLDHGLAYEAVARGQVDVIDVYSTDAKIGRYKLRVLTDDRHFFPRYDAVLLMRATLDPAPLMMLQGSIQETGMIALNAQAELDGVSFVDIARRFLSRFTAAGASRPDGSQAPAIQAGPQPVAKTSTPEGGAISSGRDFLAKLFAPDLVPLILQHLALLSGSLALAVALGIPLGVLAWLKPRLAVWLLGAVGVLQTIPSLALLAFLIALLGAIGFVPALVALVLYALLPIVRNTHTGLAGVSKGLTQAACALGLTQAQVLWKIQLPLARPMLWAGVKTAAVINVGTATMAAFIGAGGLGERIVTGLAINDNAMLLSGAIPAALLAILVQFLFDAIERCTTANRLPGDG
jgi:osmoprotectant transport system permease protein